MLAASVSPYHRPEDKKFFAIKKEYKRIFGIQNSQQSVKKGISIIIAAHQAEMYIEECLDSIKNQSYFVNNYNYQVIVCADGCEKTLQKLNSIQSKYQNLTITSTSKKLGTFVTLNNLLRSCRHNSIMHFHAEDIMSPELVEEVMQYVDSFDIVKFDYQDFRDNLSNKVDNRFWFNGGVCVYNKKVISLTGGFLPWVYAADIELIERVYNHVKIKKIEKVLYYKREMPGDMKLGTQKHPRKEFLQKIRRYSMNENVCISPAKVELPIEEVKDDEVEEITPNKEMLLTQKTNEEITPVKPGISILVTAYKSQNFIEECLDSIEKQSYFKDNNEFEVLLGIDACQETFNKVQEIRHKYRNLSVYMMKENKGPYVALNTLLNVVKYDNLIIFGSDDVMMKFMISEIMNNHEKPDIIQFKFKSFTNNIQIAIKEGAMFAIGAIFIKRGVFDMAGAYMPWRCSGDYELMTRIQGRVKMHRIPKELFFRRVHANSLSQKSDTALGSPLRLQYNKSVRHYQPHENIKIERVINEYEKIDVNYNKEVLVTNENKNGISIIIAAYEAQDFIEECLDSINSQTYFKENYNYEILIGVDGCKDTLYKLEEIYYKYRNLYVYKMNSNKGAYITTNTLLNLAKYQNLIIFGADDVMMPNMIEKILLYAYNFDVVRFGFNDFTTSIKHSEKRTNMCAWGAIYYKKQIVNLFGGYQAWVCSADYELVSRITNHVVIKEIKESLFYRRIHDKSLSHREDIGMKSAFRQKYHDQIRIYSAQENIKINKITNTFEYIPHLHRNNIAICIPMYKRPEITNFVLDYYKQLKEKIKTKIELILICCGSEGEISQKIAVNNNFIYIEHKNLPLTEKHNALYLTAKNYNPDACIKIDSDSIITKEFFNYYDDLIKDDYDYSGIEDVYFLIKNFFCYWSGYTNYRKGETTGVGRFMSKKLLTALNWKPWGEVNLNDTVLRPVIDIELSKSIGKLNINKFKFTSTKCAKINGMSIDLKSEVNICNFSDFVFDQIIKVEDIDIGVDFSKIENYLQYHENIKLKKL